MILGKKYCGPAPGACQRSRSVATARALHDSLVTVARSGDPSGQSPPGRAPRGLRCAAKNYIPFTQVTRSQTVTLCVP